MESSINFMNLSNLSAGLREIALLGANKNPRFIIAFLSRLNNIANCTAHQSSTTRNQNSCWHLCKCCWLPRLRQKTLQNEINQLLKIDRNLKVFVLSTRIHRSNVVFTLFILKNYNLKRFCYRIIVCSKLKNEILTYIYK